MTAKILPFNRMRAIRDENAVVIEAICGPVKPKEPTIEDFAEMAGTALLQLSEDLRTIAEGFQCMARKAKGGPDEAA